jgi:hypothetical protein
MKVRHKKLRRGSIAFTCGVFSIGSDGLLSPEPTEAQWKLFGNAQMYFEVQREGALERRTDVAPAAAASLAAAVAAAPAPEYAPVPLPVPEPEPSPEPEPVAESNEEVFSMDDDEDDEDDGGEADGFSDDVDPNADTVDATLYSGMSTEELRTLCRERGIRTARVNKTDLISLLNASDLGV